MDKATDVEKVYERFVYIKEMGIKMVVYVMLFLLGVCSLTDVLYQKIWIPLLIPAVGMLGYVLYLDEKNVLVYGVCAFFVLCFFGVFCWMSGGKIGKGDVLLLGIVSFGCGPWEGVMVIFVSFCLAALTGGLFMMIRRKKKDYRMAFVPCLLAGYSLAMLLLSYQ